MKSLFFVFLLASLGCLGFTNDNLFNHKNEFAASKCTPSGEEHCTKTSDQCDLPTKCKTVVCAKKKSCEPEEPCICDCKVGITLAFKPSYFWPQDHVFRDIHDGGYLSLLEFTYTFYKGLGIFAESGYFYSHSHVTSVDIRASTSVTQVPSTIGLIYAYSIYSFWDIYAKIGPNLLYTKTEINIPGLKHTIHKNTFGGTFGLGTRFKLYESWFIDIFATYLYDHKEVHDYDAGVTFRRYLGGIQTGAGLGYRF